METYKVVIIDEDKVEYYGKAAANTYHSKYLYEYIKSNYSDDKILSRLTDMVSPEQLACFLVYLKNKAVMLNETKIDGNGNAKYGKFACMILPNDISEKLLNNLLSIDGLANYNQVIIERVRLTEENILEDNLIYDYDDKSIKERLMLLSKDNKKTR